MNTDQHGNNPCYSVFFRGLFTRVIPCFSAAYLPVLFRVFPWLIYPCYSVFFRGLFTRVIPCFSVAYSPVLFRVFPWLIHPCYSVFFRGLVCGFTFWLK